MPPCRGVRGCSARQGPRGRASTSIIPGLIPDRALTVVEGEDAGTLAALGLKLAISAAEGRALPGFGSAGEGGNAARVVLAGAPYVGGIARAVRAHLAERPDVDAERVEARIVRARHVPGFGPADGPGVSIDELARGCARLGTFGEPSRVLLVLEMPGPLPDNAAARLADLAEREGIAVALLTAGVASWCGIRCNLLHFSPASGDGTLSRGGETLARCRLADTPDGGTHLAWERP